MSSIADMTDSPVDSGAAYVRKAAIDPAPPPSSVAGPWAWVRSHLLSGPFNIIMTVLILALMVWVIPPFLNFVFFDAVWSGKDREACILTEQRPVVGACWAFVRDRAAYFTYGSYPVPERWRVDVFFALLAVGVVWLLWLRAPRRDIGAAYFFVLLPLLSYGLLIGASPLAFLDNFWVRVIVALVAAAGVAGLFSSYYRKAGAITLGAILAAFVFHGLWDGLSLPVVETHLWGGILVTIVCSAVGIVVSLPVGILLALGRRSSMPAIRLVSVIYIEFVRGVPLITVLFMASVMLPLFVPPFLQPDKLLRALIGIALFAAAYMAEVVRAGLQALPKGQYEGAMALGLPYGQMMRLIVLPQALKITIPNIVNTYIGLFKDTTLVVIVGIFDFLKAIEAARIDPTWAAPTVSTTGYLYAAVFYFICCYAMSRYARSVEQRLAVADKR